MLASANLASVTYRYPDLLQNPADTPGPVEQWWWTAPYRYRQARPDIIPGRAVIVLASVACYEYQACEHPEWETSNARAFCEALRHTAIEHLPGYSDAPWGWTRDYAPVTRERKS
jgi:hypothetical protein